MRRLMFIVPLVLIGTLLHMPEEGVSQDGQSYTQAEIFGYEASLGIIEDWTERYIAATTLEGEAVDTLAELRDEIDSTDLPYQNETTVRLKAQVVDVIEETINNPKHENMTEGFYVLERLGQEYEVRP